MDWIPNGFETAFIAKWLSVYYLCAILKYIFSVSAMEGPILHPLAYALFVAEYTEDYYHSFWLHFKI